MQQSSPPLDNIAELLETGDPQAVSDILANAHPADIADALEQLNPDQRPIVWEMVPHAQTGEVLAELGEEVFKDLASDLENEDLIDSIKLLDIDDIADLVPDLEEELLADVLSAVDPQTRDSLGEVLSYPEDSAGGLMNVDATVVRDDVTLEVVLRFLRQRGSLPQQTDSIYMVDRANVLTGILPIERLITSPIEDTALTHRLENPVIFSSLDDQETVAKAFADYDLVSAPVISEEGRLLGRITIDDVVDVIREQAEHDIMATAGLKNEADVFAPVAKTSRNRAVWLGVNLITALLGSWVIGQFEGSIQQLVALAVLMPIVASMGGNAGTQTLTVMIRGMSTGTISSVNLKNVLKKEAMVGVLNGLLWAVVIAVIATLWYKNVELGLVIACAMVANLVMGAIAGVFIPVLLQRLDIDPALAGGVALTTVTDVVGYFAVLGLATWFLL
ncbi:MAG: magnesium transporter [Gammaproteobacteria bacterium]|nr:magnesium transporter [Gammaproteobacteria bacterium]